MAEDMPDDAGGLSVQTWECRRRGWEEEKQGRGSQAMATANAVIHERRMRNNDTRRTSSRTFIRSSLRW